MHILVVVHGSLPDDNEYFGPFRTEDEAIGYVDTLKRDERKIDDFTIVEVSPPSLCNLPDDPIADADERRDFIRKNYDGN